MTLTLKVKLIADESQTKWIERAILVHSYEIQLFILSRITLNSEFMAQGLIHFVLETPEPAAVR